MTNLDHVEGFVGLAAHSIQSRVHGSQGHQGWRICSQVEFYSVPRTILLATIHVQLQLAEAGGGGQSEWGELPSVLCNFSVPQTKSTPCLQSPCLPSLLTPLAYTHTISPDASYLALTAPSLDVHSQGVGHRDAPMIVEGHKVEGGCQVMVHKQGDRGQVPPGLSMYRHDLAPGYNLGREQCLLHCTSSALKLLPHPKGSFLPETLLHPCPPLQPSSCIPCSRSERSSH